MQPDRELLAGFLMEAWDILAGLEAGVSGLTTRAAHQASAMLLLFSHRLSGSAALYGLPEVSSLGKAIEGLVRSDGDGPWPADDRRLFLLEDALGELRAAFDALGRSGNEPAGMVAALRARHGEAFALAPGAAPVPEPATVPEPALQQGPGAELGVGGEIVRELHAFARANPEVLEYFIPEAQESLEAVVSALDGLRQGGADPEAVTVLFRSVHTLKGAAYTVGARPLGDLSHALEDLLVPLREGRMDPSPPVLRALETGAEALGLMVRAAQGQSPPALGAAVAEARTLLAGLTAGEIAALPAESGGEPEEIEEPITEGITGAQEPFRRGAGASAGPARISPAGARPTIRVQLDRLDQLMNLMGELVIGRSRIASRVQRLDAVEELLTANRQRMERAVGEFNEKYLDPQIRAASEGRAEPVPGGDAGGDRLPVDPLPAGGWAEAFGELEFDRYDDFNILARRIGELSNDLEEVGRELVRELSGLRADSDRIQQLTRELRNSISRARMVPLGQLFARFTRVARSAAEEAGKKVSLELSGEAVEVDNLIAEQIADPLLHLVQNAVIHGIEAEEDRLARGKSAAGRIQLRAETRGRSIVVEVTDDGAGMSGETLGRHAVAAGFLSAGEVSAMTPEELLELIFLPGFSTSTVVTQKAGRGVGLDVVRGNLSRLGGEIETETEPGVGTTFRLKLPLTLAISEALLVRLGGETFALPVTAVAGMMDLRLGPQAYEEGIEVEGERLELLRPEQLLGLRPAAQRGLTSVVMMRAGGRRVGLPVDELLDVQEVVIKGLGDFLAGLSQFAGATVGAEGDVILMLNPTALAQAGRLAAPTSRALEEGWVHGVPRRAAPRQQDRRIWGSVLLVDDSISARKVLGAQLGRAGLAVTTAVDGQEALERLREQTFDAVVTDLEMPRVNGYELIEEVRRRPATRELPILVITTRAGSKHQELARRLGVDAYFAKPVDEGQLIARLRAAVAPQAGLPPIESAVR